MQPHCGPKPAPPATEWRQVVAHGASRGYQRKKIKSPGWGDRTMAHPQCGANSGKIKTAGQTHLNSMVFELRLSLTPRLQPGVAALTPALSRFNGFPECDGKPLKRLRFLHPTIHRAEAAVLIRELEDLAFALIKTRQTIACAMFS